MIPNGPPNALECALAIRFNEIGLEQDDLDKEEWQRFLSGQAALFVQWRITGGNFPVTEKTVGLMERML